jgi:hypothetical protein
MVSPLLLTFVFGLTTPGAAILRRRHDPKLAAVVVIEIEARMEKH